MQLSRIPSSPYAFPLLSPLTAKDTAFISIDMQGDFCLDGGYMSALGIDIAPLQAPIPFAAQLLDIARQLSFPVIHTREGFADNLVDAQPNRLWRGADGRRPIFGDLGVLGRYLVRGQPCWEIIRELAPLPGEPIFDKPSYGAFSTTDIDIFLKRHSIRNIIAFGVTSDCCVHQTVQEALDRGYDCLTVSDASAAAFSSVHDHLMDQISRKGGVFGAVANTRTVLDALAPG